MHNYSIKILDANTQLTGFTSGNEDLDDFVKSDAVSNIDDWISITKVLSVDEKVIGFFTITLDTLHKERIEYSDKIAEYPYQKYPAIKLARLAVDRKYQHKGYGSDLMSEFFKTAIIIVKNGGGRFITVDAKKEACGFYERYGFRSVRSQNNRDIISMYVDFKRLYSLSKNS